MKYNLYHLIAGSILIIASLALGGCASLGTTPWERDILARISMQPDTHPLITTVDQHIYFSKEAASGGRSFGGGGCGCN